MSRNNLTNKHTNDYKSLPKEFKKSAKNAKGGEQQFPSASWMNNGWIHHLFHSPIHTTVFALDQWWTTN